MTKIVVVELVKLGVGRPFCGDVHQVVSRALDLVADSGFSGWDLGS